MIFLRFLVSLCQANLKIPSTNVPALSWHSMRQMMVNQSHVNKMMLHLYQIIYTLLPSISVWEYLVIEKLLIGLVCLIGQVFRVGKMATLFKARIVFSILPVEKIFLAMIFLSSMLKLSNSQDSQYDYQIKIEHIFFFIFIQNLFGY